MRQQQSPETKTYKCFTVVLVRSAPQFFFTISLNSIASLT